MRENGESLPETLLCGRCASIGDPDDNFCRSCGLALQPQYLPSIREAGTPAVWQAALPAAVVRGATFVAAGTLAELLLRRLVRGVLGRRRSRPAPPAKRTEGELVPRDETADEAHVVSETFLLRRVRIRR